MKKDVTYDSEDNEDEDVFEENMNEEFQSIAEEVVRYLFTPSNMPHLCIDK